MSIRMTGGLGARVVQVLEDYLPAELDLIDTEESDGITTPDIATTDYHAWDIKKIPEYPACSLEYVTTRELEKSPYVSASRRVTDEHRIIVKFHVTKAVAARSGVSVPEDVQALIRRYVAGGRRVLCVVYNRLQTTGDPNPFAGVEVVDFAGEATYGPEQDQADGAIAITGTLPITIRRRETR